MNESASHYRQHARSRALQRYSLVLSDADFSSIESRIGQSPSMLISQRDERQVWLIGWCGRFLTIVWDTFLKETITFLPANSRGFGRMRRFKSVAA